MNNQAKILHQLMTTAKINSYLELSRKSGVSEVYFYRLENNLLDNIPVGILKKIAQTLNISLNTFIDKFNTNLELVKSDNLDNSQQDKKLNNEEFTSFLMAEYQQETINILESLLLQLPTITHAINNNPHIPAMRLLPLLEPLNQLLLSWEIETIGMVGDIVIYDVKNHELIENFSLSAEKIRKVEIRYVGYRQGEKLLYRAKVSPIND